MSRTLWTARAVTAWQGLRTRDRRVLAVLALALVLAAELLLVWPMRGKRLGVLNAVSAEQQAFQDAESQRVSERATRLDALQRQLDITEAELARLGAVSARAEPLSTLMQRSVAAQGLSLRGLRALPVEELRISPPEAAASAAGAGQLAPTTVLYRHRVQLQIAGPALPLMRALDRLAQDMQPLRVERVRVAGNGAGQAQATLVLATIGSERTWLEL